MTKNDEVNFLHLMHLEGIKKTESGYNFRCPICGDSKKNRRLKRCWALTRKDPQHLVIFCHNCSYSNRFKYFLKEVNSYLFIEYTKKEKEDYIELLKSGQINKKLKIQNSINIDTPIQYQFKLNQKYFKPAKNYEKAVDFCKKRNILDKINSLYYCIHPNNICSGMIIFPCYMEDRETLYSFTGRHTEFKRFYIHSKNESFKVYNIFNVDLCENVFIFESIIDSYTVENSIAALGADISQNVLKLIKQPIFVFDNDHTGRLKTKKYLQKNYKCFIPPDSFYYKDFNEAICNEWTKEKLNRLVHNNLYSGMEGLIKINFKLMKKQ